MKPEDQHMGLVVVIVARQLEDVLPLGAVDGDGLGSARDRGFSTASSAAEDTLHGGQEENEDRRQLDVHCGRSMVRTDLSWMDGGKIIDDHELNDMVI